MLIRRGDQTAWFSYKSAGARVDVASNSVDLVAEADGENIDLRVWLSRTCSTRFTLRPDEARRYAARIVKAADQAEKKAKGVARG